MEAIVYDPVDGKQMTKKDAYAESDGLFFGSLETQQMYYKLMESGFEVATVGGKPSLRPRVPQKIWSDQVSLRSTSSDASGRLEKRSLEAGDYTLKCQVPDLTSSITGLRKATIKVIVTGGNNSVVLSNDFAIDKNSPSKELKFALGEETAGATLVIKIKSNSLLKSVHVTCELDFLPMSKFKKEIADARRLSNKVAKPDEYVVELVKGTTGIGMTLGWDKNLRAVVIRSIEENGAAARTKRLKVGDRLIGIQGTRLDNMSFKAVIKMLRNVPTTVVLLVTNLPAGYVMPTAVPNRVRKLADRKKPPPRPPRTSITAPKNKAAAKQPPPIPPARKSLPHNKPPPIPTAAKVTPPMPPQVSKPPPTPPARSKRPSAPVAATPPVPPARTSVPRPPPVQSAKSSDSNSTASLAPDRRPPSRASAPPVPTHNGPPAVPTSHKNKIPDPIPVEVSSLPTQHQAPPSALPEYENMAPPPSVNQQTSKPLVQEQSGLPPTRQAPTRTPPPPPPARQNSVPPPIPPPGRRAPQRTPSTDSPAAKGSFAGMEKYDRMRAMGLPEGAVRNAMARDSVEPPTGYFDSPAQSSHSSPPSQPPEIVQGSPSQSHAPSSAPQAFPGMDKYDRMRAMGLPEGAVRNAMARDSVQVPPGYFSSTLTDSTVSSASSVPAAPPPAPPIPSPGSFPGLEKYERMRSKGLPDGAILNAMRRDMVTPPDGFFQDPSIANESHKHVEPISIHPAASPQSPPPPPQQNSGGMSLLDSIKNKPKLRPVSSPPPPPPSASGGGAGLSMLDQIKAGGNLRHVSKSPSKTEEAPSSGVNPLLAAIQGVRLKPTEPKEEEPEERHDPSNPLGSAISRALDERRNFLEGSDSEESDEEWNDDDEWQI